MRLYIGNPTRQIIDFVYRLPEAPGARSQSVPIGGQVAVTGDLTRDQVDHIVDQHVKYGLTHVDAIDRTKPFIGLVYSVDRSISSDKLQRSLEHNSNVLVMRGQKLRQEAAVAESNRIENHIENEKMPIKLNEFEVTIVEEARADAPSPEFSEGITVSRESQGSEPPARRGRGRPRKMAA